MVKGSCLPFTVKKSQLLMWISAYIWMSPAVSGRDTGCGPIPPGSPTGWRPNFLNDTDGIPRGDWAKQWSGESFVHILWSHHRDVFNYFDDWVLIQANEDNTEIRDIVLHKKERQHTETIAWGKR